MEQDVVSLDKETGEKFDFLCRKLNVHKSDIVLGLIQNFIEFKEEEFGIEKIENEKIFFKQKKRNVNYRNKTLEKNKKVDDDFFKIIKDEVVKLDDVKKEEKKKVEILNEEKKEISKMIKSEIINLSSIK